MNRRKKDQEIQNELETLSPLLAKLRKDDSGFAVPEHYFQNLPEEILEKVGLTSNTIIAKEENDRIIIKS